VTALLPGMVRHAHRERLHIVIPAKAGIQLFDLTGFPPSRERQHGLGLSKDLFSACLIPDTGAGRLTGGEFLLKQNPAQ